MISMVELLRVERRSAVLTPSSLACLSRIPTVNLTAGCAHGCVYCYTRAYSTYPGEGTIKLYTNTLTRLREELSRKRTKPVAVYFSPSSDVFQPVAEVLEMAYSIFEYLFKAGIGVAFLTKGLIPQRHMKLLQANASLVRAQVGVSSLDSELLSALEPHCPTPEARLKQIKELVAAGIMTQARLDPILPGLTDDAATLKGLCSALAEAGVKQLAASALFLRTGVIYSLKQHIQDKALLKKLLVPFNAGGRLAIHAEKSSVFALPPEMRQSIYWRVQEIAQQNGMSVRVCACKNPDLATESCGIAGDWALPASAAAQQSLFDGI